MIQVTTLQRARLPIIGLAALGLIALGGAAATHVSIGSTDQAALVIETSTLTPTVAVQPSPASDTSSCGQGAYVTGDMAGDTSPAAVLAAMCGSR
jgi:hypothetical protein